MDMSMLHEPISMPASEEGQIRELYNLLELGVPALVGPAGERLDLPETVYRLLKGIVKNMHQGRTIMLVPEQAHLTTQKVAHILGVSRPHVIKLLDSGEIPFHKTGSHRRVFLTDALAYAKNRDAKRKSILDEIAKEAFEDGLYDNPQMPSGGEDE
jgi:excisionase family DNA binding protein